MATEWVYWLKKDGGIGQVSFTARTSDVCAKLTNAYAKNNRQILGFYCYSNVIEIWFLCTAYGAEQLMPEQVPKAIRALQLIQG